MIIKNIDFGIHTNWVFNLSFSQEFKIQTLQDFHDIHKSLDIYLENNWNHTTSKDQPERSSFMVLNCKFQESGFHEQFAI